MTGSPIAELVTDTYAARADALPAPRQQKLVRLMFVDSLFDQACADVRRIVGRMEVPESVRTEAEKLVRSLYPNEGYGKLPEVEAVL